jgi:hypothetical protein
LNVSVLQIIEFGRSSWITVTQSEIKLLRAFGNSDYWKLITRLQTPRRGLGGNELVGEHWHWGDMREILFEDAKANIVTGPQDDVPLGVIERSLASLDENSGDMTIMNGWSDRREWQIQ